MSKQHDLLFKIGALYIYTLEMQNCWFDGIILVFTDVTLDPKSILAAIKSVEYSDYLGEILGIPPTRMKEIKEKTFSDSEYREKLINHWRYTHHFASWEHLGGQLLYYGENTALQEVKKMIKPKEGW